MDPNRRRQGGRGRRLDGSRVPQLPWAEVSNPYLPMEVLSEQELGFDAIKGVPTGGHFFGEPHTMERYEHAFYRPLVSNWQNYENWQLGGGKDATQRATEIWKQALKEYEEPAMEPSIREALDAYVARRRAEIGSGEP